MFNKISVEVYNDPASRGRYSAQELQRLDEYLTNTLLVLPFKPFIGEKICFLLSESLGVEVSEEDMITATVCEIAHNLFNQETIIAVSI